VTLLTPAPGLLRLAKGRLVAARALWLYGGAVRDALVRMKHQPSPAVVAQLAELLALECPTPPRPQGLLVPVPSLPLHWLTRGFSPPQELARRLSRCWGWKLAPALAMRGLGHGQAGRGGAARRRGQRLRLKGAGARQVEGRHLVLLDDVATTGATLREGATLLLDAGAASVQALVLAVVEPLPWR
jgi:predicted amidophosphoribosyltransferase